MISDFVSIDIYLETHLPDFLNDVPEIVRAFSPHLNVSKDENCLHFVLEYIVNSNNNAIIDIRLKELIKSITLPSYINYYSPNLSEKSVIKKLIKTEVYKFCVYLTGINLPYGSLTGVRPTKLIYSKNGILSNIKSYFIEEYFVSDDRAGLIEEVIRNQYGYYNPDSKRIDVFVNVPICKTKCNYCSFGTVCLNKVESLIEQYIDCVCEEISFSLDNLRANTTIKNIYIGGGTPTCIPIGQLKRILSKLRGLSNEFTVEAGRPDSINDDLLSVLEEYGVSRISINPQTFNQQTLDSIGRSHTVKNIHEAYNLARKRNFIINMDLIAGLPHEDIDIFSNSVNETILLKPENITIHTLSVKKGSELKNKGFVKDTNGLTKIMVDYSIQKLKDEGYVPYYMYRQKNMLDNLENIGFCLPSKQCSYNIDYMEETNSVLGFGAGAMTKIIDFSKNKIERHCNKKDLNLYCFDIQSKMSN